VNQPQQLADDRPRRAPETDPTNPYHEEAAGIFLPGDRAVGRSPDEPGLTDEDRDRREHGR
jgi:hypothetical protein